METVEKKVESLPHPAPLPGTQGLKGAECEPKGISSVPGTGEGHASRIEGTQEPPWGACRLYQMAFHGRTIPFSLIPGGQQMSTAPWSFETHLWLSDHPLDHFCGALDCWVTCSHNGHVSQATVLLFWWCLSLSPGRGKAGPFPQSDTVKATSLP